MTKAELIKFLEPFDDDIPILIYWGNTSSISSLRPTYPKYVVASEDEEMASEGLVTKGDGFILILGS